MDQIYILAIIVVAAYILQIVFGLRQIKHFNTVYSQLRHKGRVAIGRRSGKIKVGTIVMFALDASGNVLDARKMQGTTVMATFKPMLNYIGQDIHYLDKYNPIVRSENKLLQTAIEDARELFLRVEAGNYKDVPKVASPFNMTDNLKALVTHFKLQMKK
ncbi:transcriptional regulator GutM [Streptococcus sp. CSL10205-OR2]|uniref:transcriptional regulator GutM n=1 Tax=Streptococcus sp. CSL10205-OR2 TaxID=2980558 RepID=UPI0021DAC522|nr:transcriptional regulator GutM [Streptococcus sp. CSL10205-OR2]MCU9533387.1 transcriptional regulator GutM [Streptococcus sp. CSL10205-OR2]